MQNSVVLRIFLTSPARSISELILQFSVYPGELMLPRGANITKYYKIKFSLITKCQPVSLLWLLTAITTLNYLIMFTQGQKNIFHTKLTQFFPIGLAVLEQVAD